MDMEALAALIVAHQTQLLVVVLCCALIPVSFALIDLAVTKAGDLYSFLVRDTARLETLKANRRRRSEDLIQ